MSTNNKITFIERAILLLFNELTIDINSQ